MNDDTFKNEVLDRLRQIMEMLASLLPEACVEEPEESGAPDGGHPPAKAAEGFSIENEMQENYRFAVEKWKEEHGGA